MTPMPPPALSKEQLLKQRVEEFGGKLYEEWEARMFDEIAAAANATEGITAEDIKRFGPFINHMMLRLFCLGVSAAIMAYPEFTGEVMRPPTDKDLGVQVQ